MIVVEIPLDVLWTENLFEMKHSYHLGNHIGNGITHTQETESKRESGREMEKEKLEEFRSHSNEFAWCSSNIVTFEPFQIRLFEIP